jgi:hypothetical protein
MYSTEKCLDDTDFCISWMTELLLMGHSPATVRHIMALEPQEFERLLTRAVSINRATELLLRGHSWKAVRDEVNLTKHEFDLVLEKAIDKARAEQKRIEARYNKRQESIRGDYETAAQ